MGKPAEGPSKGAPAPPKADSAGLLDIIAAFDKTITTDGILDLSLFVAGETVYRVPDVQGETRDYVVPNDLPFPVALAFIVARDASIKAEASLQKVDEADDAAVNEALAAQDAAWGKLTAALAAILRIRQPDLDVEDLNAHGAGAIRNLVGAIWLMLVGHQLRQAQGSASPKGPANRAERRRTERAASSR
jgi:hypothetical protein